jgi:hypothetical protein
MNSASPNIERISEFVMPVDAIRFFVADTLTRNINYTKTEESSMNQQIAFCGLDCAKCEAYLATQANDDAAKARIVAKWQVEFNSPDIPLEAATCDGCVKVGGRLGGYCGQCPIRACGVAHKIANCAYCTDYDGCGKLVDLFKSAPDARARLDALRPTL